MKQEKPKKKTAPAEPKSTFDQQDFAFDKMNYKWLLIALGFLVVGFILMIGGGSDDPNVFNYGMFNFQRLTLSPILLMVGYAIGIYAIMKKPKDTK
jgi:cytochrome bd-type quinol oxidase subunit 2